MPIVVGVVVAIVLVLMGLGDNSDPTSGGDAYDDAAMAFQGSPSHGEVKVLLDRALTLYGNPVNAATLRGTTNVLVAMHEQHGYAETEILEQMICGYVPGVVLGPPESIAVAIASMNIGDTC